MKNKIELDCNGEVWFPDETHHVFWIEWDIVDGHIELTTQTLVTRKRAFESPYDLNDLV